jgi:hypothetical protein
MLVIFCLLLVASLVARVAMPMYLNVIRWTRLEMTISGCNHWMEGEVVMIQVFLPNTIIEMTPIQA